MHWKLEALLQNIIAPLPFSNDIYYLGQRIAGSFRTFDITGKIRQSASLLDTMESAGLSIAEQETVEIGSGWIPIVPLFMWLHGQARCHSFDVVNLVRPALLRQTAQQLVSRQEELTGFLTDVDPSRWAQLPQLIEADDIVSQLAASCGIHLHAPVDTGAVPLPDGSADMVYSNTVLEHVPATEIPRIFSEAYRLLRPGGHMAHQIDLSDHFSHSDPKLSPLNFLRFSEQQFARYNNAILYQNRWRTRQYREAIEKSGFTIAYWHTLTNPQAQAAIKTLPLDSAFRTHSEHELYVTGIQVVAQKSWRQLMENTASNSHSLRTDDQQKPEISQPVVSVILPILNEAEFIEDCLYAIYMQDYPHSLMEIIIADGLSTDGTRDIIQRHVDGYRPIGPNDKPLAGAANVRMVDNPKRIVSAAMNIAIEASVGTVIVRIDGHTIIEPDYVTQCVAALERSKADGVGGAMRAIGKGFRAKAIALATSSRFGIGNSTYRTSNYFKELAVETTHMGAYRKSILLEVGLFNEYFVRHQDYELDYRIRRRGGAILLSPEIKSIYYVRGSLRKLWRQYFQYGFWKGRFLRTNFGSIRLRHMVPPALFLALLVGALLTGLQVPYGALLFLAVNVVYLSFLIAASIALCRGEKRPYLGIVPIILACLHLSWGMGVWFGLLLPDFMSPKRWRR